MLHNYMEDAANIVAKNMDYDFTIRLLEDLEYIAQQHLSDSDLLTLAHHINTLLSRSN